MIMVGEVRDEETARTAIQAALTGHLVFSTLHTNDACSAITRLINMGVEPYLIGAALNMVLAQRLVRRICAKCRPDLRAAPHHPQGPGAHGLRAARRSTRAWAARPAATRASRAASASTSCWSSATSSATPSSPIPASATIRRIAAADGMITLRHDGFRKVREGMTTVEEIFHIVGDVAVDGGSGAVESRAESSQ